MSPSDQFMAADVVVVVTFQFLTPVLFGQVAYKSYSCTFLWSTGQKSICYLGCFLVLRKPTLLFCFVGIDKLSSLQHQELTTIMQYIISVTSISISPLIPKPLS